ncbi:MAG TPA: glycosyltransferase family 2 protein [Thermoleophilaceae bacterium]|nr:glycosyltransferase family 2 protein [Thermoleophilaceae bacterium]
MQARIVIRARDEAATIGTTLTRLAEQTLAPESEVVVVDSGSRDGTVEIARRAGARVIEIPAQSFTYGGALNAGCEDARTPLLVALSAHAPPRDSRWLERLLSAFADPRVACACGYPTGPDGRPLTGPLTQDLELARAHPLWGYSNSAGAFRAELWRERPFREDMPATEDKEWAWHWLELGRVVVVDPSFATEHSDHRDEGPVAAYRRARNVWRGFAMFLDLEPYGAGHLARDWWTGLDGYPSHVRARIGWRRATKLLGRWAGTKGSR